MSMPAFRFVATDNVTALADKQFWRDVESSDRLASSATVDTYLRELCRMKAIEDAGTLNTEDDLAFFREREKALLHQVSERGYRLTDPDAEEDCFGFASGHAMLVG